MNKTRLPDFIIIGAAKSGTTSLCNYLSQHPSIFISIPKEPCYFDKNVSWERGIEWYSSLFTRAGNKQLCGEASTNYTRWPQVDGVPELIQQIIPNVKLIYIMRDPVERAFSHFVHRWTKETHPGEPFTETFTQYIQHDPMCIDSSQYALQISRYLNIFPKNQLLLLTFEQLIINPTLTMNEILMFLGLSPFNNNELRLPSSNENKLFRYHVVRNTIIDKFKTIPGFKLFLSLLPTSLKEYLYNKYFIKSKYAKKIKTQFEPIFLHEFEKDTLRLLFKESNDELVKKWNVNIINWEK